MVLASAVTLMSACASGHHETRTFAPRLTVTSPPGRAASSGPVPDTSPYWCDLVSRRALSRVTGVSGGLSEFRSVGSGKENSMCAVKDEQRYGPLAVQWDVTGGRNEIGQWAKNVAADHPARLPATLGSGFTVYSPSTSRLPYFTAAAFACGSRDAWIEIFIRGVSSGRDAAADLVGLMRVAQRRFEVLHHCTPTAAASG
jgi:hypothetical protein